MSFFKANAADLQLDENRLRRIRSGARCWASPSRFVGEAPVMTILLRALCLVLIATTVSVAAPERSKAASAAEIDADVRATADKFALQVRGARELAAKAEGVLVFPSVVKAGFGFGGEYGEGALLVRGRPNTYYNIVSASFGFQIGVQSRSIIIMFMSRDALDQFDRTAGWKVGVDGSVVLVTLGADGSIDTNNLTSPVIGFVLDQKGLMYNLTLEGSKITRINP
jgi:lipid-binding SYLF domain-containing protein